MLTTIYKGIPSHKMIFVIFKALPLIALKTRIKKRKEILADQIRKQEEEERKILEAVREERALLSNKEIADGTIYDKPLKTSWKPPRWILSR